MSDDVLESLVGRTVRDAGETEQGYIVLLLDDGRHIQFQGLGYDGLWEDVYATVLREDHTADTPPPEPHSGTS